MKVLQISDIHLNRNAKRKMSIFHTKKHFSFTEERVNRVFYIIDSCIKQYGKIDCIVFTGDIFDKRYPTSQDYYDVFNLFYYINTSLKIKCCFMAGNHDDQTVLRKSPLISLSHLFEDFENEEYNRIGLSITDPQKYFITENSYIILAPWNTPIQYIHNLKEENNKKCIVFMHCGVFDGKSHWVENDLELGNIPLTDIQSLECPVGIGHFHGQMELAKNIWYCGSPECFTFGEENQRKGALLWDFSQKEVNVIPIQAPFSQYKTYDKIFLNIVDEEKDKDRYIRIKDEVTLQEYKNIVNKAKYYKCHGISLNMTFVKPEKINTLDISKKINDEEILTSVINKENLFTEKMKNSIIEKHSIIEQKLLEISI